ncbi:MAG: DUF2723 domain-containing protein [Myxococcales bacterium]|nr:DUF2723 domain-containing protein [Myxococcales bacterium]
MSAPDDALRAEGAGPTAAVFALAGGFLAWTCLAGPQWYDSAEFAAAGWRLTLSHPPGHPVHAVVTRAAQLLPLGDGAFRANLTSALCVAAALAGLYRLLRRVAPAAGRLPTAGAALLPAVMPAVWLQAARAEVYALQLLFTVALIEGCRRVARGDDARALPALALTFGLAGANHSYLGALVIPLALWAMAVGERRPRAVGAAAAAGLLGLCAYAYLPLRAGAGGEIGWGAPRSAADLWSTISGAAWRRTLTPDADAVDLLDNVATLAAWGIDQVGPLAALLGLGLVLAAAPAWVRTRAWTAAAALLVMALPFLSRVIYPLDTANPDLGGYLVGALSLGAGLVTLAAAHLGPARWALPLLVLAAAPRFDAGARLHSRTGERFARAVLAEVPPDGVLLTSDYATSFLGWSLRAVEGLRPDVAIVFRGQMDTPWFAARLARQRPDRAAGLAEGFAGPEARYEPGVELGRLGPLAARLRPVGLTMAVGATAPMEQVQAAFTALGPPADADARRARAFLHAQTAAHLARARAATPLARWHLEQAELLAPGDPYLAEVGALLP